jgi:predicted dehydrogenase/threonine dehydrogenase-like Zn-dependent dehydrogenase
LSRCSEIAAPIIVKQIAQYQDGRLELQEVPQPVAPPGGALVRTCHSVISVGTEKMKVEQAKMNLLQKARARPDQVRKVMETAKNLGWKNALEKVRNRLETPTPLGYSAAGEVVAVNEGNTRLRIGDRVACAGAECAFHAEYIAAPDLLLAPIPDGVASWQAAYTTVASIALQAVRQAKPTLGEKILVIGQGLIGLLITNLLNIAGARVMAVDLQSTRKPFVEAMGAESFIIPSEQGLADEVRAWTQGYGVDAAIVCTATQSNEPIVQAAENLRDRGRLVDVGITKIELPWKVFYEKELEVVFSRSYGPGRYDPAYEWAGCDYPIGYVRWTEQRNFDACLHLMKTGQLKLGSLTTCRMPFTKALDAYAAIMREGSPEIGVILEYAPIKRGADVKGRLAPDQSPGEGVTSLSHRLLNAQPVERLDVIGAGNFARTMLLPHLKGKIPLGVVVNQTTLSASHVRSKFGFKEAATDTTAIFSKTGPAGVLIATRHHLHEPLVKAALSSHKHVFVEKPLCLTRGELRNIDAAMSESNGTVQVGFNRRFAPASVELRELLEGISGPKSAVYKVMAGRLDPQHWYANYMESGGRVIGEACHFLDFFCYLFGSRPLRALAQTTWPPEGRLDYPDSVTAQVEFSDGSCGQLIYSAEGDMSYPKETITVFGAGIIAEITNFLRLTVYRQRRQKVTRYSSKGHAEQMEAWRAFLLCQGEHRLPYSVTRQSMLLTFAAIESIQKGKSVEIEF